MKQQVDYIIVGSGLAGTALACALLDRGRQVRIFNDRQLYSSTKVAAGLYNPITGRKMVKTWKADAIFPALIVYYQKLEALTQAKFLNESRIYRPFISFEEQNEWMGKSAQSGYVDYIHKVRISSFNSGINDPYGGMELKMSGFLDTEAFHKAMRQFFQLKGVLIQDKFDFRDIQFVSDKAVYRDITASKIIFCDGTYASSNPFFNWLPFSPVKGEVLTVESDLDTDLIVNRGVFCVPLGGGKFRVGSNYDNNDLTWTPTEKGKQQIEQRLKALINTPFTTVYQKAGVRPATKDRRPYIGLYPSNETIGIFNGLGTKGVSLSPYFGEHFASFLEGETELDNEVNISRYFSLSSDSQ
ncbi:MAG: FAD-dependent oxidoreductase [Bacteroidota bacterium]